MLLLLRKKLQDKIKRSATNTQVKRTSSDQFSKQLLSYLFPTSSPETVCPSTMVNAPIPHKEINEFSQKAAFTSTCSISSISTEPHLFTWKYEVLQYLCPSCCGVDETNMCVLQCFLTMVTPQSESTHQNMDMCCHLVIQFIFSHNKALCKNDLASLCYDSFHNTDCAASLHSFKQHKLRQGDGCHETSW